MPNFTTYVSVSERHESFVNVASIKKRLRNSLNWLRQPSSEHLRLGQRGERAAARFLKKKHYRILTRNYRCPSGEIDLIAVDGETLVFVEVRTRSHLDQEQPADIIGPMKWSRVERSARYFLLQQSMQHRPSRFDFVAIHWPNHRPPVIEHFLDAYHARSK